MQNSYYEDEISLLDIVKFFIRHSRLIAITTLICGVVGVAVILLLSSKEKSFTAESAIIVLGTKSDVSVEPKSSLLGIKEIADIYPPRLEDRKRTIVELAKSPLIVSKVINKAYELKLYTNKLSVDDFVAPNSKILEVKQVGEIIKIKTKLYDRGLAKFFADEIAKAVVKYAKEELYIDLPEQQKDKLIKIAYLSILPDKPERGMSKKLSIAIIFFVGIFIGIFAAMLKDVYLRIRQEGIIK
ncbi:MAG: Wzz/FepE/Etk N-terminal domain-containing protein [Elusimicrobiota bacterium]|nr:Wzz/FepE/Etk N-terminal domain-containing protein [Elusimicrobiota bacterium]